MTSLISGLFSHRNTGGGSNKALKAAVNTADDDFESEFEFESETAPLAVPAMIAVSYTHLTLPTICSV